MRPERRLRFKGEKVQSFLLSLIIQEFLMLLINRNYPLGLRSVWFQDVVCSEICSLLSAIVFIPQFDSVSALVFCLAVSHYSGFPFLPPSAAFYPFPSISISTMRNLFIKCLLFVYFNTCSLHCSPITLIL